ncbi:hypothetical protein JRQ81_003130 [Phrynocephalus forsythii]|uniref:Uncharacterized protein n=1 Tax=Phrynocephalus forsythii TaxID=171643 RepID=A0A9Q0XJ91_9SAUR|nr:hypothetical protein JRQ81_003130 [Phrynocephalus forsythii]
MWLCGSMKTSSRQLVPLSKVPQHWLPTLPQMPKHQQIGSAKNTATKCSLEPHLSHTRFHPRLQRNQNAACHHRHSTPTTPHPGEETGGPDKPEMTAGKHTICRCYPPPQRPNTQEAKREEGRGRAASEHVDWPNSRAGAANHQAKESRAERASITTAVAAAAALAPSGPFICRQADGAPSRATSTAKAVARFGERLGRETLPRQHRDGKNEGRSSHFRFLREKPQEEANFYAAFPTSMFSPLWPP